MTSDEWDLMAISQNHKCLICGTNQLTVDHCHQCGKVRALLCRYCNDNIAWLEQHYFNIWIELKRCSCNDNWLK